MKASCCCGDASIEFEGDPKVNAICHCNNCRARTGSAFGWSVYVGDGQIVARSGELKVYGLAHLEQQRWFCVRCGTTLYWKAKTFMVGMTGIAGGCLPAGEIGEPSWTASDANRCAWLTLPASWTVG